MNYGGPISPKGPLPGSVSASFAKTGLNKSLVCYVFFVTPHKYKSLSIFACDPNETMQNLARHSFRCSFCLL